MNCIVADFPKSFPILSYKNLESGLCDDCKWIEVARREKVQCDYCKKQVEVRDTERVGQQGTACFDCILL
jgi:hypothetical protein